MELGAVTRFTRVTILSGEEQNGQNLPDADQLERAFSYYPRLRKVKEYVDEHIDEPITLRNVAKVAPLDPNYFSYFFRIRTGQRFSRWLNRCRVERAKSLLANQDVAITLVAHRVGYNHLRTFQRNFKSIVGLTPSQYRQEHRPDA